MSLLRATTPKKSVLDIVIAPMLLTLRESPPKGQHAYEVKWDGIRALAAIANGRLRLTSRNLLDISRDYPELKPLGSIAALDGCIFDGEIVVLDSKGVPNFQRLQRRFRVGSEAISEHLSRGAPVNYVIFDILYRNGRDVMDEAYAARRRMLDELKLDGPNWSTPPSFQGDPEVFLEATRSMNMEGIVAKELNSTYVPGKRSGAWSKIKNRIGQELIVGGWLPGQGSRTGVPGALLLGYYDVSAQEAKQRKQAQRLVYAGKCGTGYSMKTLEELEAALTAREIAKSPFDLYAPRYREARYVRPELVADFELAGWTDAHMVRHSSFRGLRTDKPARDVVREVSA